MMYTNEETTGAEITCVTINFLILSLKKKPGVCRGNIIES